MVGLPWYAEDISIPFISIPGYLDVGQDWCGGVCRFSRSGHISITDIVLSSQCVLFAWHNNNALLVAPLWVIILVQCNAPPLGCPLRHLEKIWHKSKVAVRLDEDGLKNTLGEFSETDWKPRVLSWLWLEIHIKRIWFELFTAQHWGSRFIV